MALSGWLGERGVRRMLGAAVAVDAGYWAAWYGHRSWVATGTGSAYVEFENAFLLADTWLALSCLLAWRSLRLRRPAALLWLLVAGGAGLYLLAMDVLYDLQHGIYTRGSGGLVELAVNALTLVFSVSALDWAWSHRAQLSGTHERG
ncbi:MAG: hypothetical protein M3N21_05945 [Actinomycetota bacterium]|nr:hypothetical protein [Actinomycetota bacterium]